MVSLVSPSAFPAVRCGHFILSTRSGYLHRHNYVLEELYLSGSQYLSRKVIESINTVADNETLVAGPYIDFLPRYLQDIRDFYPEITDIHHPIQAWL